MAPTLTQADLTDRYPAVQSFYARQMRLLDAGKLDEYGDTYTENAELTHSPSRRSPAYSRAEIVHAQVEGRRATESNPVQRRHWVSMIDIEPGPEGTLASTAYCLMVQLRDGQAPGFSSSVFHDVLVLLPGGGLRVRSRLIAHD